MPRHSNETIHNTLIAALLATIWATVTDADFDQWYRVTARDPGSIDVIPVVVRMVDPIPFAVLGWAP